MRAVWEFLLPLKIESPNKLDHWRKRLAYKKKIRDRILWQYKIDKPSLGLPAVVRLCRIAPRTLDAHDNLPSALKPAADAIAQILYPDSRLGQKDSSDAITWLYSQDRGKVREYYLKVEIFDPGANMEVF